MTPLSFRIGLRARIVLWAFVPTAIILILVAVVTYVAYQKVTERLVLQRDQELTRLAASQIGATVRNYLSVLEAESRRPKLLSASAVIRQDALEESRRRLLIFDGGLLILNRTGTILGATGTHPSISDYEWSQQSIFLDVIQKRSATIADNAIALQGATSLLPFGVPILRESDEVAGLLLGFFVIGPESTSPFYGDIVRLRIEREGIAYLVDGNGQVLYHSDLTPINQDLSEQTVVRQVLGLVSTGPGINDRRGEAMRTRGPDNTPIVAGFAPVPGTKWGLVTETEWWLLLSASQEFQPMLAALLLLGVIAPALFIAVGVRRIIHPIRLLTEATQKVAGGDFSQSIDVRSGDEIETLARDFNHMSAQLRSSYGLLERRVAERTRELTILNQMAEAVNRSLDLDDTLNGALEKMCLALGTECGGINLFDAGRQQLTLVAHRGLPDSLVSQIKTIGVGEGFNGFVAESGCALSIDDLGANYLQQKNIDADIGVSSLACVPLLHKGQVIGTLFTTDVQPRNFTDQDLMLLSSIGSHAATAIENAKLYQHAQQLAAMEERSRLARELHDSVTQSLYSLTLLAEGWRRMAEAGSIDNLIEPLEELGDLGKQALKEMRLLVYELRPPDLEEDGLLGALHKRLSAVENRAGIDARLTADDVLDLPHAVEENLYWIAREALANALKHASASVVRVRLYLSESERYPRGRASTEVPLLETAVGTPDQSPLLASSTWFASHRNNRTAVANESHLEHVQMPLVQIATQADDAAGYDTEELVSGSVLIMEIEDNGIGFQMDELETESQNFGGMGLRTMLERTNQLAGSLEIESQSPKGTVVRVTIPLNKERNMRHE